MSNQVSEGVGHLVHAGGPGEVAFNKFQGSSKAQISSSRNYQFPNSHLDFPWWRRNNFTGGHDMS
jgi:hypothetical protein